MEPIDYRQALLQRWRLIVAGAVVGIIGGVLYPLHIPHPIPHTEYQTSVLVGVTPGGGPPTLGQVDFFAANEQVIVSAARSVGIKEGYASLSQSITVGTSRKKKSGSPNGTIVLSVKQRSAKRSADLANAYAKSIGNYIQNELNNQYQNELNAATQNACNLEAQVNNIDDQISSLIAPNGPEGTPASKSPGLQNGNCNSTSGSTSGSSTNSSVKFRRGGPAHAVLDAGTSTTPTTPHTQVSAPTTTTTTTIPNTAQNNSAVADLEAQRQALTTQYVTAVQKVQTLTDNGAQQSGYLVLQPASSLQAKKIPGGLSILDHRSVRGLLGMLVGALVAAGVALLLAGFDKRLRTVRRAEETFGFAVIAQIPQVARPLSVRGRSDPPPPVPVLTAPSSVQAEAYRMLRMAVDRGPLGRSAMSSFTEAALHQANGNGHGNGNGNSALMGTGVPATVAKSGSALAGTTPLWISEPVTVTGAPVRPPVVAAPVGHNGGDRRHQVVLVVSAASEPTRSLVVANLCATYAESGLRTHLVTTEDLRADGWVPPAGLFETPTEIGIDEIEASSTPTQILGVRRLGLGQLIDGPGQLGAAAPKVVAACRQMADEVVIDVSSLLTTYDAEALVPWVDLVVVVGEAGMTTVDQAREAGEFLRRIEAPVTGVVMTNMPPSRAEMRAAREAARSRPSSRSLRRPRRGAASVAKPPRQPRRTKAPWQPKSPKASNDVPRDKGKKKGKDKPEAQAMDTSAQQAATQQLELKDIEAQKVPGGRRRHLNLRRHPHESASKQDKSASKQDRSASKQDKSASKQES